jgi:hydroxyacylglutathione hydrolase
MIDLPETRADVFAGSFRPGRYEFLGFIDALAAPSVHVAEWLEPGAIIDLGGQRFSEYRKTAARLLATLPGDTVLWTAHCCRRGEGISAPWLTMGDLHDLNDALGRISAGEAKADGLYPRIYPVNRQMTLAAGLPWNDR